MNQKLVATILEKRGYTVALAGNGAEALEAMNAVPYQLVLMDVQMPVMDGFETTRAMRATPHLRNVPVIAMTARAMEGDQEECLAAGMNGFVTKPIHAGHLAGVVEEFLTPAGQSSGVAAS